MYSTRLLQTAASRTLCAAAHTPSAHGWPRTLGAGCLASVAAFASGSIIASQVQNSAAAALASGGSAFLSMGVLAPRSSKVWVIPCSFLVAASVATGGALLINSAIESHATMNEEEQTLYARKFEALTPAFEAHAEGCGGGGSSTDGQSRAMLKALKTVWAIAVNASADSSWNASRGTDTIDVATIVAATEQPEFEVAIKAIFDHLKEEASGRERGAMSPSGSSSSSGDDIETSSYAPVVRHLIVDAASLLDVDDDGTITFTEFATTALSLLAVLSLQRLQQQKQKSLQWESMDSDTRAHVLFSCFDADGSGAVSKRELVAWIRVLLDFDLIVPEEGFRPDSSFVNVGHQLWDVTVKRLDVADALAEHWMRIADSNHDGDVDFEEFKAVLASRIRLTARTDEAGDGERRQE